MSTHAKVLSLTLPLALLAVITPEINAQHAGHGASAPAATCAGEAVDFSGATHYLLKTDRVGETVVTGRYVYEDHPTGRPHVLLNAGGTGAYEVWGADGSGGPGTEIEGEWFVLGDCAGAPTVTQSGPGGAAYVLAFRWTRSYPPTHQAGVLDFNQLIVATDGRRIINGERVLR